MTSNQLAYLDYVRKQAQEGQALAEARRANLAKEGENIRSNVAKELETKRHNVKMERIGAVEAGTKVAKTTSDVLLGPIKAIFGGK